MTLTIGQIDPQVLHRFQKAVGIGKVYGPWTKTRTRTHKLPMTVYRYNANGGWAEVQAVVAMLWFKLSPVKRAQAAEALTRYYRIRHERAQEPVERPAVSHAACDHPRTRAARNHCRRDSLARLA